MPTGTALDGLTPEELDALLQPAPEEGPDLLGGLSPEELAVLEQDLAAEVQNTPQPPPPPTPGSVEESTQGVQSIQEGARKQFQGNTDVGSFLSQLGQLISGSTRNPNNIPELTFGDSTIAEDGTVNTDFKPLGLGLATNDEERLNAILAANPGATVGTDPESNQQVITLPSGQQGLANAPGLSRRDFDEFTSQFLVGGAASKLAAPLKGLFGQNTLIAKGAGKVLGTGGVAVAEAGTEAARQAFFDNQAEILGKEGQGIDATRIALVAGLGVASEVVGPLAEGLTRFVQNRRFVRGNTLTESGREQFENLGIDSDLINGNAEFIDVFKRGRVGSKAEDTVQSVLAGGATSRELTGEATSANVAGGRIQEGLRGAAEQAETKRRILNDRARRKAGEVTFKGPQVFQSTKSVLESLEFRGLNGKDFAEKQLARFNKKVLGVPEKRTRDFLNGRSDIIEDTDIVSSSTRTQTKGNKTVADRSQLNRTNNLTGNSTQSDVSKSGNIQSNTDNTVERTVTKKTKKQKKPIKPEDGSLANYAAFRAELTELGGSKKRGKAALALRSELDDVFLNLGLGEFIKGEGKEVAGLIVRNTQLGKKFKERFTSNRIIKDIIKKNDLTPEDTVNLLFGSAQGIPSAKSATANAVKILKRELGEDSPGFQSVKDQATQRLFATAVGPNGVLNKREFNAQLAKFRKNKSLFSEIYSEEEQKLLSNIGTGAGSKSLLQIAGDILTVRSGVQGNAIAGSVRRLAGLQDQPPETFQSLFSPVIAGASIATLGAAEESQP